MLDHQAVIVNAHKGDSAAYRTGFTHRRYVDREGGGVHSEIMVLKVAA